MANINAQERQILTVVVKAIAAAGYDPKAQLTGYLHTGNAAYITRQYGARKLVRHLKLQTIGSYLAEGRRKIA